MLGGASVMSCKGVPASSSSVPEIVEPGQTGVSRSSPGTSHTASGSAPASSNACTARAKSTCRGRAHMAACRGVQPHGKTAARGSAPAASKARAQAASPCKAASASKGMPVSVGVFGSVHHFARAAATLLFPACRAEARV